MTNNFQKNSLTNMKHQFLLLKTILFYFMSKTKPKCVISFVKEQFFFYNNYTIWEILDPGIIIIALGVKSIFNLLMKFKIK